MLHQVLLPHQHDVMIEDVSLGSRWLVLSLRAKAQQSLVAYRLPEDGSMPAQLSNGQVISFDEAAYELSGGEGSRYTVTSVYVVVLLFVVGLSCTRTCAT
jgi:protease II